MVPPNCVVDFSGVVPSSSGKKLAFRLLENMNAESPLAEERVARELLGDAGHSPETTHSPQTTDHCPQASNHRPQLGTQSVKEAPKGSAHGNAHKAPSDETARD